MGDGGSSTSGKLGECVINMEEKSIGRLDKWVTEMTEKISRMEEREKEVPEKKQRERLQKFYTCKMLDEHEFLSPERVFMRRGLATEEMEKSLLHFLRRTKRGLDRYSAALSKVSVKLKEGWEELGYPWEFEDAQHFVQMMLLKGAFFLEFAHAKELYFWRSVLRSRYAAAALDNRVMGRIVEDHEETKRYLRDFLLMGNQLPLMVLETLLMVAYPHRNDTVRRIDLLMAIATTFFPMYNEYQIKGIYSEFNGSLHILDVYQRCLVHRDFKRAKTKTRKSRLKFHSKNIHIPSATALHSLGIGFTTSGSISMLNICLQGKTLTLPEIVIDSSTRSLFFNLIAFERLHKDVTKNEIASYLYFMRCLVLVADDASLLQSCGIIVTTLPSAQVADLFNEMIKDMSLDPNNPDLFGRKSTREYYSIPSGSLAPEIIDIITMVRARYDKMSIEWRKDLFQTYLKSPWAIISVVAAVLLFTLSFIQTLYTVIGYVHPNK